LRASPKSQGVPQDVAARRDDALSLTNLLLGAFAAFFCAVLLAMLLTARERAGRRGREPRGVLSFPGASPTDIVGEDQLRRALERLDDVEDAGSVRLSESDSHYIEAIRRGRLWSATLHTGSLLSSGRFSAGSTSHYSEWEARRRRASGWKGVFSKQTRSDEALATDHVRALFIAYLLGSRYPMELTAGD
jgi:hypothetical protein